MNASHTDSWRLVNLVPEKWASLRKYQKRKRPDAHIQQKERNSEKDNVSSEKEKETEKNLEVSVMNDIWTKLLTVVMMMTMICQA